MPSERVLRLAGRKHRAILVAEDEGAAQMAVSLQRDKRAVTKGDLSPLA